MAATMRTFFSLRPGVVRYPGGGFSTTSTNGLRAEDNAYFVDGLFNSEPYSGQAIINGAGIAGDSATILPIDSIQEFNVEEHPPAEFGWKPGAVVNVGLKSGTNSCMEPRLLLAAMATCSTRGTISTLRRTQSSANPGAIWRECRADRSSRINSFSLAPMRARCYDVGNSFGGITSPSMVANADQRRELLFL